MDSVTLYEGEDEWVTTAVMPLLRTATPIREGRYVLVDLVAVQKQVALVSIQSEGVPREEVRAARGRSEKSRLRVVRRSQVQALVRHSRVVYNYLGVVISQWWG